MNKVKLAIGVLALAGAGQALAAGPIQGAGDVVVEAWDFNTNTSYIRDLGSLSSFLTAIGNSSGTTSLGGTSGGTIVLGGADSLFGTAFGAETTASNIVWNIVGFSTVGTNVSGFLSTTNTSPISNGGLSGASKNVVTGGVFADGSGNASGTTATSAYFTSATSPSDVGGNAGWGDTLGGQYSKTTATGFSTLTAAYVSGTNHGSGTLPVATFNFFTQNGFQDYFSLLSTGEVDFTALGQVSNTPLPAAAWLLGSGLLGLFGIARRRSA